MSGSALSVRPASFSFGIEHPSGSSRGSPPTRLSCAPRTEGRTPQRRCARRPRPLQGAAHAPSHRNGVLPYPATLNTSAAVGVTYSRGILDPGAHRPNQQSASSSFVAA